MTAIRRTLTLIVLTVAVIAGASLSAAASFSDSVTVTTTVATGAVAAPASVTITDRCQGWWYQFDVSWPASTTTRGVTGYRVVAYLNTGATYLVGQTDAATRTISMTVDQSNLSLQPRLAVTTLTTYGWSAETAKSAVLSC
ncbi:MAG TPA: hypothetical protein VK402_12405 [Blastococcus sp.]|nr:hypothetical protein [Blastococcus sp.]